MVHPLPLTSCQLAHILIFVTVTSFFKASTVNLPTPALIQIIKTYIFKNVTLFATYSLCAKRYVCGVETGL